MVWSVIEEGGPPAKTTPEEGGEWGSFSIRAQAEEVPQKKQQEWRSQRQSQVLAAGRQLASNGVWTVALGSWESGGSPG